MEDIRLNWVPLLFGTENIEIPWRGGGELPDLDRDHGEIIPRHYDGIVVQEDDKTQEVEGIFLVAPDTADETWQVPLYDKNNNSLVKTYITAALVESLSGLNDVRVETRRVGITVITEQSRDNVSGIILEDAFSIRPHFLFSTGRTRPTYGIIVNHSKRKRLEPGDFSRFTDHLVEWHSDRARHKGLLLDANEETQLANIELRDRDGKTHTISKSLDELTVIGSVRSTDQYLRVFDPQERDSIRSKVREITGAVTPSGKVNERRLSWKRKLIDEFLSWLRTNVGSFVLAASESNFRIGKSYAGVKDLTKSEFAIQGGWLDEREIIFGDGVTTSSVSRYRGIVEHGPIQNIPNREDLRYIFVFPKDRPSLANQLYFALKNGLGTFGGVESVFNMPLSKDRLDGIPVDISGCSSISEQAEAYRHAITRSIDGHEVDPKSTIAFIIAEETTPDQFPNPHYAAKAKLLDMGIVSQGVDNKTVSTNSRFRWSIGNIALATFAKLGGVPWRVSSTTSNRQLIIGVGRKKIFSPNSGGLQQVIGFTFCVSDQGQFRSINTFEPSPDVDSFWETFPARVADAVRELASEDEAVDEVIVHFPSRVGRNKIGLIEKNLKGVGTRDDSIYPFALLRITSHHPYYLWDVEHDTHLPPEGVHAQVMPRDAVLMTPGRQQKRSISTVPDKPLRVDLRASTLPSTSFPDLLRQAHRLSGANWRAFNSKEVPITRAYSERIAEELGILTRYSDDILRGIESLNKVPWFL